MITIVLCTKKPIDYKIAIELIKKEYKSVRGNEIQISLGKPPKSLYMFLPSTDMNDPVNQFEMAEDIPFIPFANPYFTYVDFHLISTAKKVVELLLPNYPELFIVDESDNRYTAVDFITQQIELENGTIKKK